MCARRSMHTDTWTPSPSLARTSATCPSWFIVTGTVRVGLPHPKSAASYALKLDDPDTFTSRSMGMEQMTLMASHPLTGS